MWSENSTHYGDPERGIFSPNQESLVKTYRKKEQHEFGEKEHD